MGRRQALLGAGIIVLFLFSFLQTKAFADEKYKVRRGDNLSKISKKFHVSVDAIKAANNLDQNALHPGQTIVIPIKKKSKADKSRTTVKTGSKDQQDTQVYVVKKRDTLRSIAGDMGVTVAEIRTLNRLRATKLRPGQKLILPKRTYERDEDLDIDDGDESVDTAAAGDVQSGGESEKKSDQPAPYKWSSPEERDLFVKVAKSFLGVPYRYGGQSLRGIDCSAFTRKIYHIFNVELPRTAREQSQTGKCIFKMNELEAGDLVFFRTRRVGLHVGIYIGKSEFVHLSSQNREAKIDQLETAYFNRRFVRGVRLKEMTKDISAVASEPAKPVKPSAIDTLSMSQSAFVQ